MLFNEAFVYALDATPVFLTLLLLSVMHSGHVLVGPGSDFPRLSRKGGDVLKQEKNTRKQEKKKERRRVF